MKKHIIKTIIAFVASVFCVGANAATALKTDPAVSSGRLDCGLAYYIVSNASKKGVADFALVRKLGRDSTASLSDEIEFSRKSMDSLSHFRRRTPLDFLTENGVSYPRTGYVSVGKDAVLYHFRDVRLARTPKLTDSTLLLLFDIVQKTSEAEPFSDGSRPDVDGQALIVAGDVNKDAILKKMDMLSLMIDRTGTDHETAPDTSAARISAFPDSVGISINEDGQSGLASVDVVFYGPRMSREMRGTSSYLISSRFWDEFRIAAEIRISTMLRRSGIPYSSVRLRRSDLADFPDMRKYSVSVWLSSADTSRVGPVILSVLSDLKRNGLAPEEYAYAKAVSDNGLYARSISHSRENSDYVSKCCSAFLYGSAIVSAKDEADFFLSSGLPDSTRRAFLNRYMASFLPLIPDDGGVDCAHLSLNMRDTLLLPVGQTKIKVKKSRNSKLSGGKIWTFSNGMTVIYKKMATNGKMFYSWILRGGISSVADLKAGEGAFYSDMLFKGDICGIDGESFERMLAAEGISMKAVAGFADTRISGSAPFDRMTLLMKSLAAVARGYSANEDLGRYYMECERLRLSSARGEYRSRLAVIDSIMCPGYRYYLNKSASGLYQDLPSRAEKFYKAQFAKANDGAIVIVGDMDEYDVRKILESALGEFRTEKYMFRRSSVLYQPVSGWSTYVSDGRHGSMDAVFSTRLILNSSNYMASQIVTMAMKDAAASTLASAGMTVNVSGAIALFPHERYTVSMSAMPADLSALPYSVKPQSYFRSLYDIRSAVAGLADSGLNDSQVALYKAALTDIYDSLQPDPEFWLKMIADRVATGKNLDFGYGDKISAVTADNVNSVLKSLYEGSMVEYIIKKD